MRARDYNVDGSVLVTNDAGQTLFIPAGKQSVQYAAIAAFLGPEEIPAKTLADILVDKQLLTAQDIALIKG